METVVPFGGLTKARDAVAASAAFASRRIAAMPVFMRLPVQVLLAAFEFSALATLKQPFSRAELTSRRRHLQTAAAWPLVPFNDLVKLVRSLAMMSYLDNPHIHRLIAYERYRGNGEGAPRAC